MRTQDGGVITQSSKSDIAAARCANLRFPSTSAPVVLSGAFLSRDRAPTHGYAATREAAMVAFAKSWRRK
jgi:hypothetical protein